MDADERGVTRRGLIGLLAGATGAVALAATGAGGTVAAAVAVAPRKKVRPLPRRAPRDVLTAADWNGVVDRLNELEDQLSR